MKNIEEKAFYGLNKLTTLDLSNNEAFEVTEIENALAGSDVLPKLSKLYITNVSVLNYRGFAIGKRFLETVSNKPLKVLDLSRTRVWFLPNLKLEDSFPFLEKLNISESGICAGSLIPYAPPFPVFNQLKYLDISYQDKFNIDFDRIKLVSGFVGSDPFYLSSKLIELYARRILTTPIEVYSTKQVCMLIKAVHAEGNLTLCFNGKPTLSKLSISENALVYLDPNVGTWLNLKELDVSKNSLGKAFAQKGYAKSLVDILINLEVFSVSENGIYAIPEDSFINARKLRVLDLSNNKLRSVTFKTHRLISLQNLDVSNNQLNVVDATSISRLQHLLKDGETDINMTTDISVNLKGNGFLCVCENRHFFEWLLTLEKGFICFRDSVDYQIDEDFIYITLQYFCFETIVIAVFVTFSTIVALLAFVSVVSIIKARKRLLLKQKIDEGKEMYNLRNEQKAKHPPVFLSFSSTDEKIVMEEMYPKLEEGLKKVLNTDSRCVAIGDRDFRPGLSLANEIIRCMEESSVVVFFITNSFCKKMWCRNEALVAHYENKPTVLMMWENVDPDLMPKHLYKHFREYARVHWVHQNGRRVMRPDWDVLCDSIVRLFTVIEVR